MSSLHTRVRTVSHPHAAEDKKAAAEAEKQRVAEEKRAAEERRRAEEAARKEAEERKKAEVGGLVILLYRYCCYGILVECAFHPMPGGSVFSILVTTCHVVLYSKLSTTVCQAPGEKKKARGGVLFRVDVFDVIGGMPGVVL